MDACSLQLLGRVPLTYLKQPAKYHAVAVPPSTDQRPFARRYNEIIDPTAGQAFQNPLEWSIIGKNLFFMGVEGLVYFGMVLVLEYYLMWQPKFRQSKSNQPQSRSQENDVAAEAARVQAINPLGSAGDSLVVRQLDKVYKSRGRTNHAVNGLSFGVHQNECFGLLGVNGEGFS